MIGLASGALKIVLALEPQDKRMSFQGVSELVVEHLGEELRRESLFVFTSTFHTIEPERPVSS